MIPPLPLPMIFGRSRKCERCGQRCPRRETCCSHCASLGERELSELKAQQEDEMVGNANLGRLFLLLAATALCLLIVLMFF